ncbi:hypothetical protein [Zooshikella harenae]|uniref:Uncharacterized protein n=1 Tax=Zooshikella harenae TaxID=2827238 RepID=A0ABS5ZE44_9GAMM|nr:hypothetical protein [Zooshikella harenae]MBU2712008.1 hypothetical protein [Zooshikella harenae]
MFDNAAKHYPAVLEVFSPLCCQLTRNFCHLTDQLTYICSQGVVLWMFYRPGTALLGNWLHEQQPSGYQT